MNAFLVKYKGYIIHAAAVAAIFLSPSVQELLRTHPNIAALGGAVWGWVLHWANGK